MIKLNDHFDYKKLILFSLPSVIMMVFTSIYFVVDGLFVSNFVGKSALAAINFVWPVVMISASIGFLFGAGGGAVVGKLLGEKKKEEANRMFSLFVYMTIFIGIAIGLFVFIFAPNIIGLMGAKGELLDNTVMYARFCIAVLPFFMIENEFQILFVTAEKPRMGMVNAIIAGVANMFFDFLFIVVFKMGLMGSALGTAIAMLLGGLFPIIYFSRNNSSLLKLGKTSFNLHHTIKAITNGSSELVSQISMSLVSALYNIQLLKYASDVGVAAYGTVMYVNFFFISIFIGYSVGVAPLISYNYGAKNYDELKNLFTKSLKIIVPLSMIMFLLSHYLAYPISYAFVRYDNYLMSLTIDCFKIQSFCYVFAGIAIFAPSFFTALNDGLTSAIISFLRTIVFQTSFVLILPLFLDIDGIWLSSVCAEMMSFTLAIIFLIIKRKNYGYNKIDNMCYNNFGGDIYESNK